MYISLQNNHLQSYWNPKGAETKLEPNLYRVEVIFKFEDL